MKNPEFGGSPKPERDEFLESHKEGWLTDARVQLNVDPAHLEAFKEILDRADIKETDKEERKLLEEYGDIPELDPKTKSHDIIIGRHMVLAEGAEKPAYDVVFYDGYKMIIPRDEADEICRKQDPQSSSFNLFEYKLRFRGAFNVDGKKREAAIQLRNKLLKELKEKTQEKAA